MERAQRIAADYENYRRRLATQRADDIDRATGRLAEALLPVLDACEAAFLQHPAEIEPLFNLMLSELKKQGLESMNLHEQPFDPHLADAVLHEPGEASLSSARSCDPATRGTARSCGRRWSRSRLSADGATIEGGDDPWRHNVSGTRRTTTRCSASAKTPRPKTSPRPTASWRATAIPTPIPATMPPKNASRRVSAAYDVLGDEAKRKEYDEVRKLGPLGGFQGGGPGGPGRVQLQRRQRRPRRPARSHVRPRPARRRPVGGSGSAAWRRRRGNPQPRLRRRRTGPHHHAAPHQRCAVQHLPRQRCQARHPAEGVLELRRSRGHRRQPRPVLVLVAVPCVRWSRCGHHRSVPDMPRHRHRASAARSARRASRPVLPTVRRSG